MLTGNECIKIVVKIFCFIYNLFVIFGCRLYVRNDEEKNWQDEEEAGMNIVTFVVLHYLALTDTIECIESILSNNGCIDCNIAIVDNASPDGNRRELLKRYNGHQRVKALLSEQNLGFSS